MVLIVLVMCLLQYAKTAGYYEQGRNLKLGMQLAPELLTWEDFLKLTDWKGEGNIEDVVGKAKA